MSEESGENFPRPPVSDHSIIAAADQGHAEAEHTLTKAEK
jgi:hypothetical protein